MIFNEDAYCINEKIYLFKNYCGVADGLRIQ